MVPFLAIFGYLEPLNFFVIYPNEKVKTQVKMVHFSKNIYSIKVSCICDQIPNSCENFAISKKQIFSSPYPYIQVMVLFCLINEIRYGDKKLKLTLKSGLVFKTQDFPRPKTYWTFNYDTQGFQNSCYLILEHPGKFCRLCFMLMVFIYKKQSLLILDSQPNMIFFLKKKIENWLCMHGSIAQDMFQQK